MFLLTKVAMILLCCVAVHSGCHYLSYKNVVKNENMEISVFISPFERKNLLTIANTYTYQGIKEIWMELRKTPCKVTENQNNNEETCIDTSSLQYGWNQILVTLDRKNNQLNFLHNNTFIYQLDNPDHLSIKKIKLDFDAAFFDCPEDEKTWEKATNKIPLVFFNGTSQIILRAKRPINRSPFLSINSALYIICYDGTYQLYLSTDLEDLSCSYNLETDENYVLPLSSELIRKSISKINSTVSIAKVIVYINNENVILSTFYEYVNQKKYESYKPQMLKHKDASLKNHQNNRANTLLAGLLFVSLIGNIAIALVAVYIFMKMNAKAALQKSSQNMPLQRGQGSVSTSKPERNSETYSYEIYNESFNPEGQNEKRH